MVLDGCNCGQRLGQVPEATGFVVTTERAQGVSAPRAVSLGVVTGVLVWMITRWLDRRNR